MQIDRRVICESSIDDVKHTRLNKTVRGNDDAVDAIVCDKHVDDLRNIAAQSRLAAGEPEVRDWRHRARDFLDLRKRHVAGVVQLSVIKAGLAKRVAARSDEKNHCAETSLTRRGAQKLYKLGRFIRHAGSREIMTASLGDFNS